MGRNGWRDGMWPLLSTPGPANAEQRRDRHGHPPRAHRVNRHRVSGGQRGLAGILASRISPARNAAATMSKALQNSGHHAGAPGLMKRWPWKKS